MSLVFVASCGARSGLFDLMTTSSSGGGAGVGGSSSGGTGGGAPVDASTETGTGGVTVDSGVDAAPPLVCSLVSMGSKVMLSFPDRHATAPSLLTLNPGSNGAPAEVALQAFANAGSSMVHDDIELIRVRIGPNFPDDALIDQGPSLVGIEAHGWAQLAPAIGGAGQVALGWHGDPNANPRVLLRFFDTDVWSASDPVTVDDDGEAVLDLALGAGLGGMGVGYAGEGYGIVFRSVDWDKKDTPTRPRVAVLDASGSVLLFKDVAPASDYPGFSTSLLWTGTTYLMATGFGDCPKGDPLCAPSSVGVSKLVPSNGDLVDNSHVELISSIPTILKNSTVRRPALAMYAGRVFVAWRENGAKDPPPLELVRIAELDVNGNLVNAPVQVASVGAIESRVTLSASDIGLIVGYAEDGDPTLSDAVPGRSRIVIHHLGFDLLPADPPIAIDATRFETYGPPYTAHLDDPRSVLVTWGGRGQADGLDVTYLARLDCTIAASPPE